MRVLARLGLLDEYGDLSVSNVAVFVTLGLLVSGWAGYPVGAAAFGLAVLGREHARRVKAEQNRFETQNIIAARKASETAAADPAVLAGIHNKIAELESAVTALKLRAGMRAVERG